MKITLAYSPCPNDTFIFNAVSAGLLPFDGHQIETRLHDVETLNRLALDGAYDLTKVSFHAYLSIRHQYRLLDVGAALGYSCGPVVVSKKELSRREMPRCKVALPGELTTAHLLFRLWAPEVSEKIFLPYDRIIPAVATGQADCGVLIHEGRFVYAQAGLRAVADLGQWWEQETGLPIPLGCIVARASLGREFHAGFEDLLRRSIQRALARPEETLPYIRAHAQELDETVLKAHIKMFVNDFTLELGGRGRAAVEKLELMAKAAGWPA
jgi:1,4-dihydroxy-6-naphthoate synthase